MRSQSGVAHEPPSHISKRSATRQHALLLPQLSVMTASSLRPARVKSTTSVATAAAETNTAPVVPTVFSSPDDGATHPLLNELLRDLVSTSSATTQIPQAVTVADALRALGGPDAVEMLLAQLNDASFSADVSDDATFARILETCVTRVLGISAPSMSAIEKHTVAKPNEARTADASTDALTVKVAIPLDLPGLKVDAFTPSATIPCVTVVDDSATACGRGRYSSPCVLLRIQRCRGVLSLRVVSIRFEGTHLNKPSRGTRDLKGEDHSGQKPSQVKHSKYPQRRHLFYNTKRQPAPIAAANSVPLPLPTLSGGMTEGFGMENVTSVDSAAAEATASLSPVVSVGSSSRHTTASHAKSSREHRKGKSAVLQRSNMVAVACHSKSKKDPSVVRFDPLRPEETTPFNPQCRPLTYKVAIPFS